MEKLGSGEFGDVCKALWSISGATRAMAIKSLKPGSSESDKIRFLQEAAIMGQFNHPFVLKLYGVVTVGDPVSILFPWLYHSCRCYGYYNVHIPFQFSLACSKNLWHLIPVVDNQLILPSLLAMQGKFVYSWHWFSITFIDNHLHWTDD